MAICLYSTCFVARVSYLASTLTCNKINQDFHMHEQVTAKPQEELSDTLNKRRTRKLQSSSLDIIRSPNRHSMLIIPLLAQRQ